LYGQVVHVKNRFARARAVLHFNSIIRPATAPSLLSGSVGKLQQVQIT
jgi:hypothetical protein